ncbi:MAG TPA: RNA methyltransferase [Feifaniaceae bacterium]|nr:RNA methyltransferase [Feifaniaceae bacterium]
MKIESRSNEIVKRAKSLALAKNRQAYALHLIEGRKLLQEAISSKMAVREAFFEEGAEQEFLEERSLLEARGTAIYAVARPVIEAMCDTKTPQRVCATVETSPFIGRFPSGMLVALDTVQDPGNLGAILRTADAMGANALLLSNGCADPYSPKSLRAAMGSTYHVPLWKGDLYGALKALKAEGYTLLCGHLNGSATLPEPGKNCAVVIGNEGSGVSEEIASLCRLVKLPMYGRAESLNASMAAGLLLYETAKRMHGGMAEK